ncbi:MAG: HK97 family phage prohead protease [Ignavibacteria bacterium]|nr:HK97 family phage prohead protease [Ignavibacteria bacterium]
METIYKTYRAEVKSVNETDGTVDMFIPVSTNSVDRDGEIVEPSAFKRTLPAFMKRPVLVASHDYHDLTNQIGEWKRLKITPDGMDGQPQYYVNDGNEQADWAFKLAKRGVAAFSIGFIPKKWVDGDGKKAPLRTYSDVELLEISQVIVPSNRDAIQSLRGKSAGNAVVLELLDEAEKELVTKPEETDNTIRLPVAAEEGKHKDCKIRTIALSADEGVSALYCVDDKVVITYLFDKEKGWTMAKARAWVKEHSKSIVVLELESSGEVIEERAFSQETIQDEIDYLLTMIDEVGLSDETREIGSELVKRFAGSDMPETDKVIVEPEPPQDRAAVMTWLKEEIKRQLTEV